MVQAPVSHQYAHKKHVPTTPIKHQPSRGRLAPAAVVGPPPAAELHPTPPSTQSTLPPLPKTTPTPATPLASAPASTSVRRRSIPEIASLKPPKRFVPPSATSGKPVRPSLSEQLAAIRDQGADILEGLHRTFNVAAGDSAGGRELPLCTFRPRSVRVGSRTCDWPGVLALFGDRAEYRFTHPVHRKVSMLMRYRDMSQLGLSRASGQLRFRIEHSLEYFADSYDHFNQAHYLDITLGSAADVDALTASTAWAQMQALCLSRR